MQGKVVEWLLEDSNPSVKYMTQTLLLKKTLKNPSVMETKINIMTTGAVPEILKIQNLDGSWGQSDRFYKDKYTGTVWNLLLLAELGADNEDVRIKNACEFILENSQNMDCGGFSYTRSERTGAGLFSGIIPCLTGNMVYSLIKLGYLEDSRVQKAIDWIVSYQRTDDAEGQAPIGIIYDRYKMCWGKHSCHMGVAKSLKALAAIPETNRSKAINDKIIQLVEYFLKHHIYKRSHNLDEVARPGWLKLGFPLMYQTDILEILGILNALHIKDPRMMEALNIIKSKQLPNGLWKLENSFNGKMLVDFEKKGSSSKWITLKSSLLVESFL